jgi:hypothetical protein
MQLPLPQLPSEDLVCLRASFYTNPIGFRRMPREFVFEHFERFSLGCSQAITPADHSMEIHAPEEPILTWKEFLVHIGTVTIGILIALSLENLVEWNHHRHLLNEARENIRSEIADNLSELRGSLATTNKLKQNHQNALQWVSDLESKHQSSIHELSVGANLADLSNASWTTAQETGALGLMNYAEVKRGATVYQLQDEFQRLQRASEDAAIAATVLFAGQSEDPTKTPTEQLRNERDLLQRSLSELEVKQQVGVQLEKRYESWLQAKE